MVAHVGSERHLLRQPWRSRAIQLVTALLCLASPVVFAPAALREDPAGLWLRAGLPKSVVKTLVLPGGTPSFRYALVVGEGVYQASGPNTTWQAVDRDLPSRRWNNVEAQTLAADPGDPSMVYVGMGGAGSRDPARSAGLYVTMDGGRTWQSPVKSIAGEEVQIIAAMSHVQGVAAADNNDVMTSGSMQPLEPDSVICAVTVGTIYCNTGASHLWVRLDWRGTERVLSMAIRPDDPRTIYLGTAGFGLVSTTDGGATWKPSHSDLQNRQVYDIVIPASRPDTLYVATDGGLFESADAGLTWAELRGPTQGRRVNTIALCPGTVGGDNAGFPATRSGWTLAALCVGLQHGAVYRTVDGGQNWVALARGLGSMTVLSLAVDPQDPSVLWAGTTDGVWRCSLPVAQSQALNSLSSPTGRQPSPSMILQASPATPSSATVTSSPLPEDTVEPAPTLTWTAQPTPTPTLSSTATVTPSPTATLQPTATRVVPVPPTLTRTPNPTPTSTEKPLPTPEPARPRFTPTRVPR